MFYKKKLGASKQRQNPITDIISEAICIKFAEQQSVSSSQTRLPVSRLQLAKESLTDK